MIDKLDEALETLFLTSGVGDLDTMKYSFEIPTSSWSDQIGTDPTINCYLYKIEENLTLRTNNWQHVPEGPAVRPAPPPVRINCCYIVTAWCADQSIGEQTKREHEYLSQIIQVVTAYPTIPNDLVPEPMRVIEQGLPSVALMPDAVKEVGEFWSALDNKLKPFVPLVVTLPVIPQRPREVIGRVSERRIGIGNEKPEHIRVAGMVYLGESTEKRAPNARVTIEELELRVYADQRGFFTFGNILSTILTSPTYTITVEYLHTWTDEQNETHQEMLQESVQFPIPSDSYNVHLESDNF